MAQETLTALEMSDFIAEHAGNNFYYQPAWLDLITSLYRYTSILLTTTDSRGRLSGFLPLCYLSSPLTGRRLVSLPFSDHCPLLATDEASANDLINQATRLAEERRVRYLELRTGQNEALAQRSDLTANSLYANWLIPLDASEEAAWSHLRQGARRKIRKARSLGVQVRIAERREDMLSYYRLHLLTRTKKHGMPSQPLAFFLKLWDTFAPDGTLHLELAEYEGRVIAAHITVFFGKTARYLYGASDERYHDLGAGYLLTWEEIAWGCQHDYQTLDLGRTAYNNTGLMQYKRSWGAIEEPCPYYYYPTVHGLAATSESSRKYQLVTRCWKALPLQISTPLGGYLYRHLG